MENGLSYSLETFNPTCLSPWELYHLGLLKLAMWIKRGGSKCQIFSSKATPSPVDWYFRLAPIRLVPIVRPPCQNQIWEHHNRILIPLLWILNNTYSVFYAALLHKAHHGQRWYFLKWHRGFLWFKHAIVYILSSIFITKLSKIYHEPQEIYHIIEIFADSSVLVEHLKNYVSDLHFKGFHCAAE